MSHAKLAPSAAPRWVPCPGSIALEAKYPDNDDSDKAREGTAAHEYLSGLLGKGLSLKVGDTASNGWIIDTDMADAAMMLVNDAAPFLSLGYYTETRVDAPSISPDCWGTPDLYAIDPHRRLVCVWDAKYGHGFVDAKSNWQLVCYMQGIVDSHQLTGDWRFRATVIQPRNYDSSGPIRVWNLDSAELAHLVGIAARSADGGDCNTGDHCRYCSARHVCKALAAVSDWAVEVSQEAASLDLSGDALGETITQLQTAAKRLKARLDGLEVAAIAQIKAGKIIPGYVVEHGVGHRKWNRPVDDVLALGSASGVDMHKPADLITPAQAIKLGVDETLVNEYSVRPPTGAKLVVAKTTAAKAFKK